MPGLDKPVSLDKVFSLVGDLAAARQQADDRALKATLDSLKPVLEGMLAAANKPDGGQARDQLDKVISTESTTELRQFFENVAASVITAQKELDKQSAAYSLEAAKAQLPPTRFAIPNVRAELRFGFSNLTGKSVNVFLVSSQKQREEHSESSITFDLVATPPQPKEARLTTSTKLALVTGSRRDEVLGTVLAAAKVDEDTRAQLNSADARSICIVLEYPDSDPRRYLVLWPGKSAKGGAKREVWSLFAIGVLEGDALVRDIFEKKTPVRESGNLLIIPDDDGLKKLQTADLQALVVNLGDAFMNACLTLSPAPLESK